MTIPKFSLKKTKNCTTEPFHTQQPSTLRPAISPVKSAHGFALQLFCLRKKRFFPNDQISWSEKKCSKANTLGGYLVQVPIDFFSDVG